MNRSKSKQIDFFQRIYLDESPIWEIDRPQKAVMDLLDNGEFKGKVVDLGCGTAENAIILSKQGFEVVGIDVSSKAIEIAKLKADANKAELKLICADLLEYDFQNVQFDTILDSGVFHGFSDTARNKYRKVLERIVSPEGRCHIIAWNEFEPGVDGPRRITRHEIKEIFAKGWTDISIRQTIYETTAHSDGASAWIASMTKIGN